MFGFAHFDPPRRISPLAQMVLFILEGYVAAPFLKAPFTEKGAFFLFPFFPVFPKASINVWFCPFRSAAADKPAGADGTAESGRVCRRPLFKSTPITGCFFYGVNHLRLKLTADQVTTK
jgi:hypothetical protein